MEDSRQPDDAALIRTDFAADARGRAGVGVAWTSPGATKGHIAGIFDPRTHRLLGTAEQAIDRIALVDGLGQKG